MYKTCTWCGGIHPFSSNRCQKNSGFIPNPRKDVGHKFRQTKEYRKLAKAFKKDSKYLCAVCLNEGTVNSKNVEVHHIEAIKHKPELAYDYDNLVCLCSLHHKFEKCKSDVLNKQ